LFLKQRDKRTVTTKKKKPLFRQDKEEKGKANCKNFETTKNCFSIGQGHTSSAKVQGRIEL
jgi:hypothetical protein